MPKPVVFFDVDETLLNCKSMFSFLKFFIHSKYPLNCEFVFEEYTKKIQEQVANGLPREDLNLFYYSLWKGFKQNEVREISTQWYLQNKTCNEFFITKNIEFMLNMKQDGYLIAAVSGSSFDILHSFINEYKFDKYFFSEPEVKYGEFTGLLLNPPMIGKQKSEAIISYMNKENICPVDCIAVADHESDIPMLKSVGNGYLFKNNKRCKL